MAKPVDVYVTIRTTVPMYIANDDGLYNDEGDVTDEFGQRIINSLKLVPEDIEQALIVEESLRRWAVVKVMAEVPVGTLTAGQEQLMLDNIKVVGADKIDAEIEKYYEE